MNDRDWLAEARQLLSEAVGTNDNAPTVGLNSAAYAQQRRTFLDRLQGYLLAQGEPVEAAFRAEVSRAFGKPSLEVMDDRQLAEMLTRFDKYMRMARVLATTPSRRG
ncbi:MAG: hypothetical protein H7Y60_16720 [Rhodospirillaceae bacterium]|nr:hypothetical protein [Rhodospirillales bacterium]